MEEMYGGISVALAAPMTLRMIRRISVHTCYFAFDDV